MAREQLQTGAMQVWSDLPRRELIVERVFDAPRERVWKAWTDPDQLASWWGPRGWQTTNYRFELRPGGVWHYCMRGPNGMESWGRGTFREIVEPERISYVDEFSNPEGAINEDLPGGLIIVNTFEDLGGGKTRVTSRTEFKNEDQLKALIDMGMLQGLAETWDRLAELVSAA
jgi:uncharacterized protein YndB with AHSA1/START domain